MCELSLGVQTGADPILQACVCLYGPTCSKSASLQSASLPEAMYVTSASVHNIHLSFYWSFGGREGYALQQSLTLQLS